MSMSTIQQFSTDFHRSMRHFSKLVHLPKVLRSCNVNKSRGIHISELFEWAIGTIFSRYSFERATADSRFTTKTVRNCLNDARMNWQRLGSQHFFGQFAKRLFVKLGHTRKAMLLVQGSLSVLVPLRGCKRSRCKRRLALSDH